MISRVVEQVRETASSVGQSVSGMMPHRHEEEEPTEMGGGGEMESDMNDEF
ncbi:MAG TPA: hypothetical protein VKU62_03330 [Thermoanaerobaculia bacterium]|nr:hypothetical protein [Thermoanaerobaculia bacterium]